MTEKTILIIGAGMAGLSAGCYAQMNGYRSHIFELHDKAGGLCAAWKRKGYTFDGCVHWLVGSAPPEPLHQVWMELGAIQGRQFVNYDEFSRVVFPDGKEVVFYTQADKLEAHLLEIAPEDREAIHDMAQAMRLFARFHTPIDEPPELMGPLAKAKSMARMAPYMGTFMKYGKLSWGAFAQRFQNPTLRAAMNHLVDAPEMAALFIIITLGWMQAGTAGYPIGGSLEFARAIERRYLSLGGEISYKSRVAKILVENDRAVGLRLADGTEVRGDIVVSGADGHATIFDMLEGRYVDDTIRGYYDNMTLFPPILQVSLGLGRDLSAVPHQMNYVSTDPFVVAGVEQPCFAARNYCFDPTMAPAGKSVITTYLHADYDRWTRLLADRPSYDAEKARVAEAVVQRLGRHLAGIEADVEVVDVATPKTYERYTANWKASWEGWMPTPDTAMMQMKKTLPGLDGFYMIGQWLQPGGGLPTGAQHGRHIMQIICKHDRREFMATEGAAPAPLPRVA